ncbi:thioredoxin-dependent thiol peroxidase [Arsenophonus symbiont of Ornithomya chloropus]|uniref:thioredoxin-dependent thiol peroxidase n=1 Tax=Arsenophonus symbiont of Ornithomya chloropus TaxID=634121 RepID=UPI0032B152F8
MIPLKTGDKAPLFNLPNQYAQMINSSDFIGKRILLYFYPKAMTPGCTLQASRLRDNMIFFKQKNIEVLGISTDTPEKLLHFTESQFLNFTLLSDKNHEVAEKFGIWGKKQIMGKIFQGVHRITFLINTQGFIEHVFKNFKTNEHHKILLKYLSTYK